MNKPGFEWDTEAALADYQERERKVAEEPQRPAAETGLTIPVSEVGNVVQQMITPVMEQIGAILERTNQAMERIAASQQMMSQRISDLEKQVRLKTPMSRSQEKHINDAIRLRARKLLDEKGLGEDRKALNKVAGHIRKAILTRYGAASLLDAPAYDYEVALKQAESWKDPLILRDIVKEAMARNAD